MSIFCPLSGEANVSLLETVKTKVLQKVYRRSYLKLDISSELKDVEEIGLYHCVQSDLKFFYPALMGSELLYEKLQKFDWYYQDEKYEFNYVQHRIKESDSVLEIGCGKGAFAKKIAAQEYVGLELSQKAKEITSVRGFRVLKESVETHAISKPNYYDVVCAFQVLEHVENVQSFIKASIGCLKPGGLLIYSVPNSDSFYSLVSNNLLNMPPHHVTWWSEKALVYIAKLFNLELVSVESERLASSHRKGYLAMIILSRLKSVFGIRSKLVDGSNAYWLLSKFATLAGMLLEAGLQDEKALPKGHSAIAIYRKKA